MKNLNLLLSVVIIALMATSFRSKQPKASEGFIGQVLYSMMPPQIFTDKNDDWVLMDGRDVEGSEYHRLTGLTKIPDARNQFIRGMGGKYDRADGYKNGDERTVGSVQRHSTAMPQKGFKFRHLETGKQDCFMLKVKDFKNEDPEGWEELKSMRPIIIVDCTTSSKRFSVDGGDKETRPTNIALYIYIKIND